ncbi:MAG: NAD(P)-dependent oxidoreductase [candidate division WOR-3 bacterium]
MMNYKKVFITGATGFIGSHICESLVKEGYEVSVIVRKTSNLSFIKDLNIKIYYGDLLDKESLKEPIKEVNYVIHCAGQILGKKEDYYQVNYLGTKNLIDNILELKPPLKLFIHLSTIAACGPGENIKEDKELCPLSDYGKTKLLSENLLLEYANKIPLIILRLSAIYGPRDKETLKYFKILKKKIGLVFGGSFSLCYVKDLTHLITSILKNNKEIKSGEIFNIADGNCYNFKDIVDAYEKITNDKVLKIYLPNFLVFLIGYLWQRDKIKDLTAKCYLVDIEKAKNILGFNPKYSLIEGLKETLDWYKNNNWL